MTSDEPVGRTWLHLLAIVAVVALQAVPSMFTRDLWPPDEPRYWVVSEEMRASGSYVLPRLNGEPYKEKPPLFFWCAALLQEAGLGMVSTRAVTALAVAGLLCVLYLLCRRGLGDRRALLSAFIALTTVQLLNCTRRGILDPLLSLLVTAAIAAGFAAMHRKGGRPFILWAVCYALMGLATLTKGPVGALIPLLVLLAYGAADRRNVRLGGWAHLTGAAVYMAVCLSWLLPALLAGGEEYRHVMLVKQNIGQVADSWSHPKPFYFYLEGWPRSLTPWLLILLLAMVAAFRRWGRTGSVVRLAVLWLVVPFIFFSLISAKRMNYLLPAVPAAGVLCAWYVGLGKEEKGGFLRVEKWLFGVSFVGVGAAAVGTAGLLFAYPGWAARHYAGTGYPAQVRELLSPSRTVIGLVLLALPLSLVVWGLLRPSASGSRKAWLLVWAVLLIGSTLDIFLLPVLNPTKSDRQFGMRVRELTGDAPVYLYGSDFAGRFNLWTGRRRMPRFWAEGRLRRILADPQGFVVSERAHFLRALTPEEIDYYAVAEGRLDEDRPLLLRGRLPAEPGTPAARDGAQSPRPERSER